MVTTEDALRGQWRDLADEWIAAMDTRTDAAREGLLDDWMLRLVGDVDGKSVIDLGCGEGRFSRMLAERGAQVVGIDLEPKFVHRASSRATTSERYELADMQQLNNVSDAQFDLAISTSRWWTFQINRQQCGRDTAYSSPVGAC